jgi:hypothetical protein
MAHFNALDDDDLPSTPVPPTVSDKVSQHDERYAHIRKSYDGENIEHGLSINQLAESNRRGNTKTAESVEAFNQKLAEINTAVDTFMETDFIQTAFNPPAPLKPPKWNNFLLTMANSNIYGQVDLMNAKLRQIEMGFRLVKNMCETHIADLRKEKEIMNAQAVKIYEVEKALGLDVSETMNLSDEVYELKEQVNAAKKNPYVQSYLQFHDPKNKPFSRNQSDSSHDISDRPPRYISMIQRMLMSVVAEVFIRRQTLFPNNLNTRRTRPQCVANPSPKLMIKSRTTNSSRFSMIRKR